MEEKNTLEVGDVLYSMYNGKINGKVEIVRVTATQAITSQSTRFRRDIRHLRSIQPIGTYSWSSTFFYLETEDLKNKYAQKQAVSFLSSIKWEGLTLESLTKIIDVVKTEIKC